MLTHSCRRCWLPLAALLLALLIVPASAPAATAGIPRRPVATSELIPVWAYLNGAYPVAGGRVLIMAGGKPVRQLSPGASAYTNAKGVAVVSVKRVARGFTVVVQGGRAAGRRLRGSLRSLTASSLGTSVVEVNPLTTLIFQLRAARPRLGSGRASLDVKRYFGVPWWANLAENLREGPRWFNARAYVRDVTRYGSVDRLNQVLASRILWGEPSIGRKAPELRFSTDALTARAAVSVKSEGGLAGKVLKGLAKGAGDGLLSAGIGGLLELAKAGGLPLPKNDLEKVQEQLSAIGAQLTELQGQVKQLAVSLANIDVSRLLGQSIDIISKIDTARTDLAAVAALAPGARNRIGLAKETIAYIEENLKGGPKFLDNLLNPPFKVASNPIKAMSHALATSSRFFDERQSNEVRSVYEYYATAQAQLTVLLTNYWNANPVAFSVAYRRDEIMKAADSVTKTERESLRPTVPAGTFLDTRTPRFMWGTTNRTVNALTLLDQGLEQKRTQTVGGFDNYQMPSFPDFRNLVMDRTGVHKDNPRAWLQAQVRVRLSHQLVWAHGSVRDSTTVGAGGVHRTLEVRIFDLATGREEQHGYGNSLWVNVTQCGNYSSCVGLSNLTPAARRFLASKSGGLLLLRYLAPGESYWW